MTKEEIIKERWTEFLKGLAKYSYVEGCLSINGWLSMNRLSERIRISLSAKTGELELNGDFVRPKSLSGIEKNNGWIKIESESDLPKEDGFYNLCNIDKEGYLPAEPLGILIAFYNTKTITHYQPIEKPKPPIY